MPKVTFSLVEQFSDMRSNEMAYKFMIENQGSSAIELLSILPRIPEGVELVEVKDRSLVAVKEKHSKLCSELTELLKDHLYITSKEIRAKHLQIEKEQLNEIFGHLSRMFGIFKIYLSIIKGSIFRIMERARKRFAALVFTIENKEHAEIAFQKFINIQNSPEIIKNIFELKMDQLGKLESQMQEQKSSSLATIETESFFAMTYILKFPRRYMTPKKFNLAIEGSYSEVNKEEMYVGSTTTSLVISPKPYVLTIIAIISSFLGVILKVTSEENFTSFNMEVINALIGKEGIAAAILAIIFFNVYEFTSFGKKFQMGVGWRSALLIGSLCGLMGERILEAIKVFIGI
ncbi:hypothetical protein ACFL6P_00305 [Candidatus Latescibacterota bacterium]